MISTSKLLKLARKWKNFTVIQKTRISFPTVKEVAVAPETCTVPTRIEKGHFVVYSIDNKRFVFPLPYLKNETFRQLLIMSEDEFGLPADGPLILPCSGVYMEYIISIINRGAISVQIEETLLALVSNDRCSSIITHQDLTNQCLVVC